MATPGPSSALLLPRECLPTCKWLVPAALFAPLALVPGEEEDEEVVVLPGEDEEEEGEATAAPAGCSWGSPLWSPCWYWPWR
jgi:hypothetical protein